VPRLFTRKAKPPKANIEKSANGHHDAAAGAHKVGLKPKNGWRKRNFVTGVLIPSLFRRREGQAMKAEFPKLRRGEIGVTWIGHASFLLQFGKQNVLVDPNWAKLAEGHQADQGSRHPVARPAGNRSRAGDARAL
jgi:hypothetical protein